MTNHKVPASMLNGGKFGRSTVCAIALLSFVAGWLTTAQLAHLPRFAPEDHPHPNDAGYGALGDAVDLVLFR